MCQGIIYRATNLINGKIYIGKTIQTFDERKRDHTKSRNLNKCGYFHKAIKKYGKQNFKWEIIYECDDILILNVMETFKIMVCHSHYSEGRGYNLTWGGEGTYGYKHTDETKRKISERNKGNIAWNKGKTNIYSDETKIKMSKSQSKRKHTDESKLKMSKTRKGKKLTEEHKRKISISHKKYGDDVIKEVIKQHNNGIKIKDISLSMNIPWQSVYRLLKRTFTTKCLQ